MKQLTKDMSEVDKDSVLFNWECCGGCSQNNYSFSNNNEKMDLIKYLTDKGHMLMFSDFAVRALVNSWDENLLGPNPFKLLGGCNGTIELGFNSNKLKECVSKQLQLVGQLCENGKAIIHAMSDTVVFTLKKERKTTDLYEVEPLTIAVKNQQFNSEGLSNDFVEIENNKGSVGHVIVRYKTGGKMLLSAGHWIELNKLDVNFEQLTVVAKENWGNEYDDEINDINSGKWNECEKKEKVNNLAKKFVQQSAPCKESKRKY
jgi:hypothetical protein